MNLKFRQLQYFVALAEELHFGRAAEKLNVSQPPLSQAIQQLEDELGVKLVERNSRQVSLTAAGEFFHAEARSLLERADNVIEIARQAGRGELGRLAFGFPPSLPFLPIFNATLNSFRESYPNVMIRMDETVSRDAIAGLKSGHIDMAFLRSPLPGLPDDMYCDHIHSDRLVALVHEGHPLYNKSSLSIQDLRGVPQIIIDPRQNTGLNIQLNALCEEAGFPISVAQYVSHTWTPISLAYARIGISIVYSSLVEKLSIENVRKIPVLSSNSRNNIYIASFRNAAPTVAHFRRLILGLSKKSSEL